MSRTTKQEGAAGHLKPDHGKNFLPGAEAAPDNQAPQPLDHFKRGYKERADLRDREFNLLSADHEILSLSRAVPPLNTGYGNTNEGGYNSHDRRSFNGGGSVGFDVMRLVDELCRPGCILPHVLERARGENVASFASGKALTAILSNLARRRKIGIALSVWQWMDAASIKKNVFHYNSLISVCEKMKDNKRALRLMDEMGEKGIPKNEVTFSSAISACEKVGDWRIALDLLERMKREGIARTAIAYNGAISSCEKGLVPHKALEIFEQMKREGVNPTVITYSAMISAAEKGQQWKLALEVLEEMKAAGHGANVIAYSAAISALSKGQMWEKALELFREIESSGNAPSIVTYNATMSALEKGLQWERALDLFDEMKAKGLPITVVSYGSAISACEKGLQYKQCLEFLDEMTEIGIKKNVVIFGAAMSCMEKSCRADIAFQLMERMKIEGVLPNVHIFNSAISACARCNLWEKGHELFMAMEPVGVVRDVVSYNAVLDAVSTQVPLARRLFKEGVERGFYARVSRLGTQWLELDLHFLSLGGGEIALGWWFEECLVPYLGSSSKLAAVKSIDIVTGYGKTRMRGIRHGDDGMRKRVKAMLHFMEISEVDQPNKGRIHIDKEALMVTVQKNGGKIIFDEDGYRKFKLESTTASHIPDVEQKVRPKIQLAGPIVEMPRRNQDQDNGYGRHSNNSRFVEGRGRWGSDYGGTSVNDGAPDRHTRQQESWSDHRDGPGNGGNRGHTYFGRGDSGRSSDNLGSSYGPKGGSKTETVYGTSYPNRSNYFHRSQGRDGHPQNSAFHDHRQRETDGPPTANVRQYESHSGGDHRDEGYFQFRTSYRDGHGGGYNDDIQHAHGGPENARGYGGYVQEGSICNETDSSYYGGSTGASHHNINGERTSKGNHISLQNISHYGNSGHMSEEHFVNDGRHESSFRGDHSMPRNRQTSEKSYFGNGGGNGRDMSNEKRRRDDSHCGNPSHYEERRSKGFSSVVEETHDHYGTVRNDKSYNCGRLGGDENMQHRRRSRSRERHPATRHADGGRHSFNNRGLEGFHERSQHDHPGTRRESRDYNHDHETVKRSRKY